MLNHNSLTHSLNNPLTLIVYVSIVDMPARLRYVYGAPLETIRLTCHPAGIIPLSSLCRLPSIYTNVQARLVEYQTEIVIIIHQARIQGGGGLGGTCPPRPLKKLA